MPPQPNNRGGQVLMPPDVAKQLSLEQQQLMMRRAVRAQLAQASFLELLKTEYLLARPNFKRNPVESTDPATGETIVGYTWDTSETDFDINLICLIARDAARSLMDGLDEDDAAEEKAIQEHKEKQRGTILKGMGGE